MFSPLICGSFNHQEQEEDEEVNEAWKCSPSSTPRKSRKLSFCSRCKDTKNPYADRGLDKFSTLLADLDNKLQKIYTQKGSENISFVRFAQSDSNSNDFKPIIVKVKDKKRIETTSVDQESIDKNPIKSPTNKKVKVEKIKSSCHVVENWKWPSYYSLVIMILILFGLALFGRSFAILCTSIGWYLVPRIESGIPNVKRVNKRKEYRRRSSNLKVSSDGISSPRSVLNGLNRSFSG